jgi:hypothetical protein
MTSTKQLTALSVMIAHLAIVRWGRTFTIACLLVMLQTNLYSAEIINHFSAGTYYDYSDSLVFDEVDYPRYYNKTHSLTLTGAGSSLSASFQRPVGYGIGTIPEGPKSIYIGTANAFAGMSGSHVVLRTSTYAGSNTPFNPYSLYNGPSPRSIARASYSDIVKIAGALPDSTINVVFRVQGILETTRIGRHAFLFSGTENRVGSYHGSSTQPDDGIIDVYPLYDSPIYSTVYQSYYSENTFWSPTPDINSQINYSGINMNSSTLNYYNAVASPIPTTDPNIIRWGVSYDVSHKIYYNSGYEGYLFDVGLNSSSSANGSIARTDFGNSMYVLGVTDSNGIFLEPSTYSFASGAVAIPEPSSVFVVVVLGSVITGLVLRRHRQRMKAELHSKPAAMVSNANIAEQ